MVKKKQDVIEDYVSDDEKNNKDSKEWDGITRQDKIIDFPEDGIITMADLMEDDTAEASHQIVEDVPVMVKSKKNRIPWVDKYRPKTLNDVIHQNEIVNMLKKTVETGELPHLLFFGSAGLGKTSVILALANELYGPDKASERVLELNASDERGISVVRNKIITFAKKALGSPDPKYPCPPYKIIILDEADAMTTEAQSALRKVVENLSEITRFCFICNYINKIIDPIVSRCMKFRFKPIDQKTMSERLHEIALSEGLKVNDAVISQIIEIVGGDFRRAIMTLQNLKYVHHKTLTPKDVCNISSYLPLKYIKPTWNILADEQTTVLNLVKHTNKLNATGYPINTILNQLKNIAASTNTLNDKQKALICIQLAMTEKKLIDGADEYVQLLNVFCYIQGIIKNVISYYPSYIC